MANMKGTASWNPRTAEEAAATVEGYNTRVATSTQVCSALAAAWPVVWCKL